ncbi:Gfo/Idh/MocA family protein [Chitinophaga sp. Cy-1792]|uniref:Gfo/Idh/MocA family protein n=1 Tax=Chitinophaga sp. Cy-1792 TaxID=2608339 RepID=UPI0014215F50|nr:Gfo/Idh/MocA family oxidoreductase [Chitinophaga sp. Cy-1792]NIG55328.1 Gfo/Idh/MocA family oxidoreductase [Chitinophaga sp. Cy-1792]
MKPRLPLHPQPIYIIGAGGIINSAHLPAYQLAGFVVAGIFDLSPEKAAATASSFNIPQVFSSLEAMVQAAPAGVMYDVAVPGSAILSVLQQLPPGANVLLQKPMGENLEQAAQILALVREKQMLAAVNFQLRYAPYILAAKEIIYSGYIGTLNDVEINVNVYTPWHLWDFLFTAERVEILYHSIHYIDLVRNLLGNPQGMFAKTVKHPAMQQLASVRSNIIMDYGDMVRANIITNHCHNFGNTHQHSYIKLEGDKGAIKIDFGALINYPHGIADRFGYAVTNGEGHTEWKTLAIEGSWFPHAFIGSMAQLMLAAEGSIALPDNSVEDCIHTMACVEAAYAASKLPGVPLSVFDNL